MRLTFDLPGVALVWDALPEARIVGGAVRDRLLGAGIADVDFASPWRPEDVMARLARAGIKSLPTGISHGTVTAMAAGRGFEITTLRRDVATDGRHAVVDFTDDWTADAGRRDFTINAMSVSRDGTVFDYFTGRQDLAAGRICFVGTANARVAEDYLRILRFFRFFARYGRGKADGEALTAITRHADGLAQLSAERVWGELKKIFSAQDPGAAAILMDETGVLTRIWPDAALDGVLALIARGAPADPLLRIAALLRPPVTPFAARLKMSGEEAARLNAWCGVPALRPAAGDGEIRAALADEESADLIARTWLAQDDTPGWDELRARIAATEKPVFPLAGRDLALLGVVAGPAMGKALARVRQWWRDAGCVADHQACLAFARKELGIAAAGSDGDPDA